jgi:quercetin dioxygenase-like cupin family protein
MAYGVVRPEELDWVTRPADPGDAERHLANVTEPAGLEHTRANLWRYEPGAKGRRHLDTVQEETFIVIRGTLTMYLGDPPQREQVAQGGLIHVKAETPLQVVNEGPEELLLYIYGAPPERGNAEYLDSAV